MGSITVHMVGNAHIDPVWLWPLSEGRREVLSTYRTAMRLIQEFDGYVFTSGGSITYRWVEEDDPELFAAIRKAVEEGRWALVNGWLLQPDCNIPSGESFARHALYGQRYLEEKFRRRARVGYNVDSFGHAGTLPQLLRLGGLDYYVFFRPGPHEKDLPATPFYWEAPDDSRVLAYRPPLHYNSPEQEDMRERLAAAVQRSPDDLPIIMCFYGVGNHGGGPTRHNVQALLEVMAEGGVVRPQFSSPERYFEEIEALGRDWPIVREELQHHARGCYTALSRVKRENRHSEHALMAAERFAALASALCDRPSEQCRLQGAWEKVLFNQFHDILAGTCIRSAYDEVCKGYEEACEVACHVQEGALEALAGRLTMTTEGTTAVVIWNPLAWERTEAVRFRVPVGGFRHDRVGLAYPRRVSVVDERGKPIPAQIVQVELDYSTYMAYVEAWVSVPALGCRVLQVALEIGEPPYEEPSYQQGDTLENAALCLRFDPRTGWLNSLVERGSGVEFLAGPAAVPLVIDDPSDTWSHGVASFREVVGAFSALGPPRLVADGPVSRTMRVEYGWGASTLVQDFTLHANRAAVDITMKVDWHERLKMLKLAFPLGVDSAQVMASAPYGAVRREVNGEEEPCQAWVDLSGTHDGLTMGLTVLNDSKYAYDALGGELRLSVLRSPIYAFHEPRQIFPGVTYHYTDQGEQVVRYRLLPHLGSWKERHPDRAAYEHQEPLLAREAKPGGGRSLPGALLSVEPANIVLTVAKWSEDGQRLVVRGYEAEGRPTELTLQSEPLGRQWVHTVRPWEIWTLALSLDSDEATPLNLLEEARS